MPPRLALKTARLANTLADLLILVLILLLLAVGCYAIWDAGQVYGAADARQYERYKPTPENPLSFAELQTINPEVVAWLTVFGTGIDYPVAQGEDNMKYVNTNAKGEYSLSGSIFLDSRSSKDFSDYSTILYGHHMEKKAMFGELGRFSEKAYFTARRYGQLHYGGRDYGLEFFAFLNADAYDRTVFQTRITGEAKQAAYLSKLLSMATYVRTEVAVDPQDRLVLLSTCSISATNGRDILVGRITDELYEDTFQTETTGKRIFSADRLPGQPAALVLLALLLMLLLALAVSYIGKRKKQKHSKRKKKERNETS
jgi:sortase B